MTDTTQAPIRPFDERYRAALSDARLPRNLLAFQRAWKTTRDAAFGRLATETPPLGASTPSFEAAGVRVVETDLGEWIIQLAHETPSHMVMPAIHKSRQQVGALLESEVGRPVSRDDVKAMVSLAREELRRVFLAAEAGMIGANALVAETGSVMLITNEGNGDLVSTLPRLLIVIAG